MTAGLFPVPAPDLNLTLLNRRPTLGPFQNATDIMPHPRISHLAQQANRLFSLRSSGRAAINNDVGIFIRQNGPRPLGDFFERKADGSGNPRRKESLARQ